MSKYRHIDHASAARDWFKEARRWRDQANAARKKRNFNEAERCLGHERNCREQGQIALAKANRFKVRAPISAEPIPIETHDGETQHD